MSDFNSIASRLFQADYYDYLDVLKKMLNFIESTELIKGFIDDCGGFNPETEKVVDEVMNEYHSFFKFSIDDKEEVSDIYSITLYILSISFSSYSTIF